MFSLPELRGDTGKEQGQQPSANGVVRGNDGRYCQSPDVSVDVSGGAMVLAWVARLWARLDFQVRQLLHMVNSGDVLVSAATAKELVDEAKDICRDYVFARLTRNNVPTKKLQFVPSQSTLARHFIIAGGTLEALYPKVYTDISRKISMTMSSRAAVKTTLTTVLEILFRESVTWGKVVAMFAVAAAFAEECVQQGHADFVPDVVDCVGGYVSLHLVQWLVQQGGWSSFLHYFRASGRESSPVLFLVTIAGAVVSFITTLSFIVDLR